MRMRTLPQAMEEIKAKDPGTCLTLRALRRLVSERRIPVAWMTARKPLIDLDKLETYLYEMQPEEAPAVAGIRPIPERI